jgi:hypothetical protein
MFGKQAFGGTNTIYRLQAVGEAIKNTGCAKPFFQNVMELLPKQF